MVLRTLLSHKVYGFCEKARWLLLPLSNFASSLFQFEMFRLIEGKEIPTYVLLGDLVNTALRKNKNKNTIYTLTIEKVNTFCPFAQ